MPQNSNSGVSSSPELPGRTDIVRKISYIYTFLIHVALINDNRMKLHPSSFGLSFLTAGLLVLLLFMSAGTCTAAGRHYRKGFLYRDGGQLMLDGRPYRSASFNSFQLSGCGHDYELFSDSEIDSLFASLPEGMLIRTWAFPGSEKRTAQLLELAGRHGHKLLLTLGDGRSSCGHHDGANDGDGSGKRPGWYIDGYKESYLPHVKRIVEMFKDSPAVGMWEILNEPGDAAWQVIKEFYDIVAAEIKKIDHDHLVSTGSWSPWAYGGEEPFRELHSGPHIDVGCIHEYDYDYNQSNMIESPHFQAAMNAMRDLDKVLIVEETGIESGDRCRTDRNTRAEAMRQKMDVYFRKGAAAVLVWNLAAEVRGCAFSFTPEDPMMEMIAEYPVNSRK